MCRKSLQGQRSRLKHKSMNNRSRSVLAAPIMSIENTLCNNGCNQRGSGQIQWTSMDEMSDESLDDLHLTSYRWSGSDWAVLDFFRIEGATESFSVLIHVPISSAEA